jgi:hypothetical protein
MMAATGSNECADVLSLNDPFCIVRRGGRKEMQLLEGSEEARKTDSTLVKALGRAFRWKQMLESEEFATIAELAERESIAPSYMTRVLRLTLLSSYIVEGIVERKQYRRSRSRVPRSNFRLNGLTEVGQTVDGP